jgi:hypothetical protein
MITGRSARPRRAQLAHQPESVELRHHDVREDEIGPALARGRQRGLAVRDRPDAIALGQQMSEVLPHVGVVVGDEERRPIVGAARPHRRSRRARQHLAIGRPLGLHAGAVLVRQPSHRLLDEGGRAAHARRQAAALPDLVRRQVRGSERHGDVNVVPRPTALVTRMVPP